VTLKRGPTQKDIKQVLQIFDFLF